MLAAKTIVYVSVLFGRVQPGVSELFEHNTLNECTICLVRNPSVRRWTEIGKEACSYE